MLHVAYKVVKVAKYIIQNPFGYFTYLVDKYLKKGVILFYFKKRKKYSN